MVILDDMLESNEMYPSGTIRHDRVAHNGELICHLAFASARTSAALLESSQKDNIRASWPCTNRIWTLLVHKLFAYVGLV